MDHFYIDRNGNQWPIPDFVDDWDDAPASPRTLRPLLAWAAGAWLVFGAGVLVGLLLAY